LGNSRLWDVRNAFLLGALLVKVLKALVLKKKILTGAIDEADWHKTRFNL
jgi:hypothetical protein